MSLGLVRLARTVASAPLHCATSLLGLAVGCASLLALLVLLGLWQGVGVASVGSTLRVESMVGSRPQASAGLTRADLRLLRAALPGYLVGGARLLEPAELAPPVASPRDLKIVAADPAWLDVAGIGIRSGRPLVLEDELGAGAVGLVSERLARMLVEGSPGGHHLRLDSCWVTVVGQLAGRLAQDDAVDIVLPLSSGLERLVGDEAPELSEIVVASTTGGTVSRTLVERVLQRSHGNQADWHLAGRGGAAVEQGSLARLLVAMLGLLAASTLVLSGFALASGIQRASDRGASGPPSRSRAVWLGILFGVFSAVPACLLARLFVSFAAEPLDAQLSMSLFTWLGGLVFVPAAGFVVGAVANALEPAS